MPKLVAWEAQHDQAPRPEAPAAHLGEATVLNESTLPRREPKLPGSPPARVHEVRGRPQQSGAQGVGIAE